MQPLGSRVNHVYRLEKRKALNLFLNNIFLSFLTKNIYFSLHKNNLHLKDLKLLSFHKGTISDSSCANKTPKCKFLQFGSLQLGQEKKTKKESKHSLLNASFLFPPLTMLIYDVNILPIYPMRFFCCFHLNRGCGGGIKRFQVQLTLTTRAAPGLSSIQEIMHVLYVHISLYIYV